MTQLEIDRDMTRLILEDHGEEAEVTIVERWIDEEDNIHLDEGNFHLNPAKARQMRDWLDKFINK